MVLEQRKRAKGSEHGSPSVSQTSTPISAGATSHVWDVTKAITVLAILNILLSKFITDSYLWGYNGKWSNPGLHLKPYPNLILSEDELSRYDGSLPGKPIYLAILGEVYDVSANPRMYGPGGSYHHFAGIDGARAFATGCFSSDLTHDVRGMKAAELETIAGWQRYYREKSSKYRRVGTVLHDEIPKDAPLHPPCDPKNERKSPLTRKGSSSAIKPEI